MTLISKLLLAAPTVWVLSLNANAQFQLANPGPLTQSAPNSLVAAATTPSFSGGGVDCASATLLPPGPTLTPVPFDTSTPAVAPPTNPGAGLCNFFGQTQITDEQWFSWTATSSGVARLSTCGGLAAVDTKIAIYPDDCANIALLSPLACKDDTPGCPTVSTILTWDIVANESYLIQLGNSPSLPSGSGGASDFTIEELPPRPAGQYDLGVSDNALGLVSSGDLLWMHTYDAGTGQILTAIEAAFGTPNTLAPPNGTPCTIAVYAGSPQSGLTLLTSESVVTSMTGTDVLVSFPLANPLVVTGPYAVALIAPITSATAIASLDQTVNSLGRAWIAAEIGGTIDVANPSSASTPPLELQSIQPGSFDGVFLLRVETAGPGITFVESCHGDGGDQLGCTDCPCGNNALPGTLGGCLNTFGTSARLHGSGSDSIAAGDLRFEVSGAPPATFALLTSGAMLAPGNPAHPCFGLGTGLPSTLLDGLRCVVQQTKRHGGRASALDGSIGVTTGGWGPPNGPALGAGGLPAQGGFVPGETRHFQVFYRDLMVLGCDTGLNTSQAVSLTFAP